MAAIRGNKYFHELVKAVLVYEAREVRKRLKEKYSHLLLRQYRLDNARQEIILFRDDPLEYPYPFIFADVVWFIHKNGGGRGSIVHEVKTGRFSLAGTLAKYKTAGAMINNYPVAPLKQDNTLLCLWTWKKNLERELRLNREFGLEGSMNFVRNMLKENLFRICYLEWINDLILDAVKEINEVVGYGDSRH